MFALNEINIQLCKTVFAMNNGIIVLTFHEQDLTKVLVKFCTGPRLTRGPYPAQPAIFPTVRAGKKEMNSGRAVPGPQKSVCAEL